MRNKYEGTCYFCGTKVEKQAGHFERYYGSWRTIHAGCVILNRAIKSYEENSEMSKEYWVFHNLFYYYRNLSDVVKKDFTLDCFPRKDNKVYIVAYKRHKGGTHSFHAKVMPIQYYRDINMLQRIFKYFTKIELIK
jgi:phage pi2 protein 07